MNVENRFDESDSLLNFWALLIMANVWLASGSLLGLTFAALAAVERWPVWRRMWRQRDDQ